MRLESYQEMFEKLKKRNEGAFIPFIVAGDPDYQTSLKIVKKIVYNGADAMEIGFAFSDPIADGPTVQSADLRAFGGGMTTKKAFKFIKKIRKFTSIPIGILVYYNLIYKMGVNHFYKIAKESGINAILAADLPPEESNAAISAAEKYDLNQIFLTAKTTSNERLKRITSICSGFLYIVSLMGTTGVRNEFKDSTVDLIKRIRNHTKLPLCVGFGISTPEHVNEVIKAGADGAIVGSAIIDLISANLEDPDNMMLKIQELCREMKDATIFMSG
jgi:tryptophan synthase alpha chain